jgi:hypothetical protein
VLSNAHTKTELARMTTRERAMFDGRSITPRD